MNVFYPNHGKSQGHCKEEIALFRKGMKILNQHYMMILKHIMTAFLFLACLTRLRMKERVLIFLEKLDLLDNLKRLKKFFGRRHKGSAINLMISLQQNLKNSNRLITILIFNTFRPSNRFQATTNSRNVSWLFTEIGFWFDFSGLK